MKDRPRPDPNGFGQSDWEYALDRAYVPEHIPGLMAKVSKGEPFRIGEYLGYRRENWLILVGYPLEGQFTPEGVEEVISAAKQMFQPDYLWFIGPQLPVSLREQSQEKSQDEYYLLELEGFRPKPGLHREAAKAGQLLTVRDEKVFGRDHEELASEFLKSKRLPPLVTELYRSMPEYLEGSQSARLLCARNLQDRLSAFFVIETAATTFDTYVLGCYSRKHYVSHASDLLFETMIEQASTRGKKSINLGLGVNEGIRRFKQKWGGKPFLPYMYCECYFGPPKALSMIDQWLAEGL